MNSRRWQPTDKDSKPECATLKGLTRGVPTIIRGDVGDEESRISFSFRARFLRLTSLGVGMTRFRRFFNKLLNVAQKLQVVLTKAKA